ncbi:MAG: site-specific integrase [Anaerolineae bacterium]
MDDMTPLELLPDGERQIQPESTPLSQNPAVVYLSSLPSERSRRVMRESLNRVAQLLSGGRADLLTLEWRAVGFQHTAAVRALLMERYSPATVNRILSALRGTLKAAWRLGLISADDYQKARDIENVKGETLPAGRELVMGEIFALVSACKADTREGQMSAAGARDAAIIGVLYMCGLRRAEIVSLDIGDLDLASGKLSVRSGKGRKGRTVYVREGALRALQAWLAVRGDSAGALFMPVLKNDRVSRRRMTSQAIYNLLQKRATEAGVSDFSPHDLRRTFVSDLLDRGADIALVAKLAGHQDVKTTARYDRRPEESKRRAAELLHFPF